MAKVCSDITEWIEEQVSKPVEEWEDRQEKRCKNYPWYDPRGWFCWFVTILVKVVRWVLVTVGKWVTRTVCKIISTVVDTVVAVVHGLVDVVVGIFTLDWRRILHGLIEIVLGVVLGVIGLIRIFFFGDTIAFIIEEINKQRLRDYVRKILARKYSGSTFDAIAEAIRLDHGAFGLRLKGKAIRTILDSETMSPTDPTAPNLVVLHESGRIDLRVLCGFDPQPFWNTKRYKTLKKESVIAGGGGGEFDNPISEGDLKDYLDSRGARGPKFTVIAMRDGVLSDKVSVAEEKGRELGVRLDFASSLTPVLKPGHIVHDGFDTTTSASSLNAFLVEIAGRNDKGINAAGATADLCTPVMVGVFQYTDGLRGLTSNLAASACGLAGEKTSGLTFIDNIPDQIWKYVPIHELGHYFGLCHVDGLDRIMYSSKEKSWWSWWMLPNWLYLEGEPSFVLDEAKAAWDYIVANFSATCLGAKTGAPIG